MSKNNYDELNLRKFKMSSILPDATVLLLGKRRSGKCLIKDTGILMYDGSVKKIQDIKIGDLVMGDDSTSRTVLSTHNGYDVMYKITNQFNESYVVNSQHIISFKCVFNSVITNSNNSYKVKWFDNTKLKVITKKFVYKPTDKQIDKQTDKLTVYNKIQEMLSKSSSEIINIPIKKYMTLLPKYKKFLMGYQVSVDFKKSETEIDPYLCGLLMNNHYRYSRNACILKFLNTALTQYNSYLWYDKNTQLYKITSESNLENILNQYNSLNEIPKEYKINSHENRLLFALGVLEVNNYFTNGFYMYNENDTGFNNDFIFLIKSLGYSIRKIYNGDYIKLYIYNENCKIENISDFFNIPIQKHVLNKLEIQNIGINEYFGIQINKNSLFILDNFIVTHNSWLVRDIFYHHKHIPSGVVFSGTEEANPFFSEFIPDCFIHSEYDGELIEKIMNKQKKKIRDAKREGIKDGKSPSNNLFIIFDDMLHDAQNWKNEKTIKNIFFNGRHYNFLFILTMQYALAIPPALRSNIDYVFIFNEQSLKNRRKIYDDYAAMIPTFDHFCNILDACTQNFECLVIKTSGNSTDIRDSVFWYKAKSHDNFKVGHYKFWKFHNQHYNKNHEDDCFDEEEKINELKDKFSKTKKLKVIVSRENNKIVDIDY